MTEIILKIRINHIRIEHTIIIIVIIKYSEGQRPNCNFFNLKVRNMKNIPKGLKSIKIKSIRKWDQGQGQEISCTNQEITRIQQTINLKFKPTTERAEDHLKLVQVQAPSITHETVINNPYKADS